MSFVMFYDWWSVREELIVLKYVSYKLKIYCTVGIPTISSSKLLTG